VISLVELRTTLRARRQERRRRRRLREELQSYRSSAERHDLEAILYRYDTTIEQIVAGQEPPLVTAESAAEEAWQEAWDEIVLDLASDHPRPGPPPRPE
jgi:hypothetical protein